MIGEVLYHLFNPIFSFLFFFVGSFTLFSLFFVSSCLVLNEIPSSSGRKKNQFHANKREMFMIWIEQIGNIHHGSSCEIQGKVPPMKQWNYFFHIPLLIGEYFPYKQMTQCKKLELTIWPRSIDSFWTSMTWFVLRTLQTSTFSVVF